MRFISVPALAALLLLLPSCDGWPVAPRSGTGFQAEARPPYLELSNSTSRTVYHAIFEQTLAARILWGPCDRPAECPGVAAGQQLRIRYDSVPGYDQVPEPIALVYWWHLVPHGGGFRPDSLRVIRVPL